MNSPSSVSPEQNTLFLLVRCLSLSVNPKSFKKSLLSSFFSSTNQNEKRVIKVSQSEPFKPGGRPTNFNFGLVYTSEVFEDISDITPSLITSIKYPSEMDVKLRVTVYYSSSKTSHKDILLASTTFSIRELVRSIRSKGELVSDMISEYCNNAKAYVEVIDELYKPLVHNPRFNIVATERSNENPLFQQYAFYSPHNKLQQQAHIIANEWTWEPKFSATISKMYLENIISSLIRSMYAWNIRYELERKRQGRFHSLDEALKHGWHSVDICVLGARMRRSKANTERMKLIATTNRNSSENHLRRSSSKSFSSSNTTSISAVDAHHEMNSVGPGGGSESNNISTVFLPIDSAPKLSIKPNRGGISIIACNVTLDQLHAFSMIKNDYFTV